MTVPLDVDRLRAVAGEVVDPELPVLTLADLGVLREVAVSDDGGVEVVLTPTYSGCPAMSVMAEDVTAALRRAGAGEVRVRWVLRPPWTTDWLTGAARDKLARAGIAPPPERAAGGPVPVSLTVRCPQCGSPDTWQRSRFGATACQALWSCRSCGEPFDAVKGI